MIVYYVETESAAILPRTWRRTRAEAHALAKDYHRHDPVVVQAQVRTDSAGVVAALNRTAAIEPLAAWTLSPRKGLRALPLSELAP
jgi:hypothetical protein